MNKAKLRKIIRKLANENYGLIVECNAARVRAGEWQERFQSVEQAHDMWLRSMAGLPVRGNQLDG